MDKLRLSNMAYSLAAVVVLLDQLSKYWILNVLNLPEKGQVHVTSFFDLSMVWNRGVSFGLFRSPDGQETIRWLLAGFAAVVVIGLAFWVRNVRRKWTALTIGLIMGGAVGNLIDRVRFGAVTDFLDFSKPHIPWLFHKSLNFPWVFNVADSAINIGIVLLLIETLVIGDNRGRDR